MTLQRKARIVGDSLNVVIPSQIADLHDIDEGTLLEFQPKEKGVFKMVALGKVCRIRKKGSKTTVNVKMRDGKCIPPRGWEKVK